MYGQFLADPLMSVQSLSPPQNQNRWSVGSIRVLYTRLTFMYFLSTVFLSVSWLIPYGTKSVTQIMHVPLKRQNRGRVVRANRAQRQNQDHPLTRIVGDIYDGMNMLRLIDLRRGM